MSEQEILIIRLKEFSIRPGLMTLDGLNIVHKFYVDFQKAVETEIIADYGSLSDYNKMGPWNQTQKKIEKAEWYIQRLIDNPGVNE